MLFVKIIIKLKIGQCLQYLFLGGLYHYDFIIFIYFIPISSIFSPALREPARWRISQNDFLQRSSRGLPGQVILILFPLYQSGSTLSRQRKGPLRVGCGLQPATEALLSLCSRFPNLQRVEINYSCWTSSQGEQLDNQGLLVLSSCCLPLTDLT